MVKVINSDEFNDVVLNSEEVVLVDFSADWCRYCKMLAPIIEELSEEMAGKVKVFEIDADKSPDITIKYSVMSLPTLMIFKKGELLDKIVGFNPKEIIKTKIEQYL